MARLLVGNRRLRDAGLVLLGLLGLLPVSSPAPAQDAAGIRPFYVRDLAFRVPFNMDVRDGRIGEVLLYADRDFRFDAPDDGWYWFAVQTKDAFGRSYPENLGQLQPQLKVCVDRKPPVVSLKAVAPREGNVAVAWDVQDPNLDTIWLRLEHQPAGSAAWVPLPVPMVNALPRGEYGWRAAGNGPVKVRLQARDLAKNVGTAETVATPGDPAAAPGDYRPAPASAPATTLQPPGVKHVKSKNFQLDYSAENVGPSEVKSVEIWVTEEGRGWRKYKADAPPRGPESIKVGQPGKYGFTLIPRSGAGLAAEPPRAYDPPQVWVQVDESKPLVRFTRDPVPGKGQDDANTLTVYWSATDQFLRRDGITILYRTDRNGQWTPFPDGKNVENRGYHTCSTQGLPSYKFFLRVEAVDEAGNVGFAETPQEVIVDLKIPYIPPAKITVTPGDDSQPRPPGGDGGPGLPGP
jgi:hypothetical protein